MFPPFLFVAIENCGTSDQFYRATKNGDELAEVGSEEFVGCYKLFQLLSITAKTSVKVL